jgi:hypothetical protein
MGCNLPLDQRRLARPTLVVLLCCAGVKDGVIQCARIIRQLRGQWGNRVSVTCLSSRATSMLHHCDMLPKCDIVRRAVQRYVLNKSLGPQPLLTSLLGTRRW